MTGSNVVIRGVKVGVVTEVKLMTEELDKALVVIKTLPLKEPHKLQAKLALTNFMGHSIIDLSYLKLGYVLPKVNGYTQLKVAESMMKKIQNTIEDLINENNLAQVSESGKNALEMFNKAIVQLGNGIEKGIVFLNNAAKFSEELIRFTEELKVTKNKLNQALDSTNAILQDKNLDLFLKQGLGKAAEGISGIKLITDRLNADLKEFEESPVKFLTRGKQRKGYKLIKVEAKKKID
jgi:ABC-type transporter Mla subunit MlaD